MIGRNRPKTLHHLTVTQLRLGATCPRVHYFDAVWSRQHPGRPRRVSMLWKSGGAPAGGAMFHRGVERFTRLADGLPEVGAAIDHAGSAAELHRALGGVFTERCYDPALASKPVQFQRGFSDALFVYFEELANLAWSARAAGVATTEIVSHLFGDPRKAVDVTFDLGDGPAVRVTGIVDHVFYDWRKRRHRILDYKLTPSDRPDADLVQVSTYALMHDRQHGTKPDVAVYYLHPERRMVERTWEDVDAGRAAIYDALASMVAWEAFDEATGAGLRPPGDPSACGGCTWRRECERRLGPKADGERVLRWTQGFAAGREVDPPIAVHRPPDLDDEPAVELVEDAPTEEAPPETLAPLATPAGAALTAAPATEADAAPNAAADGLWVGADSAGAPFVVRPAVLNTHVAVVGAAGSGKTWMAKVIAEETVRNGIPVIAIDPQGDLVQFLTRRDLSEVPPELRAAAAAFHDRVEVRVFTPGTSHGNKLSIDPIRLPRPEDLAAIADPIRRAEEESTLIQACAASLVDLANVPGDRDGQETFLYLLLRGLPRERGVSLEDVQRYVRDPDLVGVTDPGSLVTDAQRRTLGMRLNAFVRGGKSSLFSGGTPLDLDAMVRPDQAARTPLNVIYLNALPGDAEKQYFVGRLAVEVYRWMIGRGSADSGGPRLLFYLDEARDYLPPTRKVAAKAPLLRLFTQGRKYGVGCLVCTQSPRSVDYNVFGNCSSKVIGRLESAQDVQRVKEWFTTERAPAWLDGRKGAEAGSFVGRWAEGRAEGVPFRARMLFSRHDGAWSPDRVEREVREARERR